MGVATRNVGRTTHGYLVLVMIIALSAALAVGLTACKIEESTEPIAGAPTNPGDPAAAGIDDLDPTLVSWDEPAGDVGSWPITAKVVEGYIREDLRIVRDPADNWPHIQKPGWSKPSVGNYWVIGFVDGAWHAATVDWAGVEKTGMAEAPCFCGRDDIHGPLAGWRPQPGETAYLMMSTHARTGVIDGNMQRTNIYKITMP